MVQIVIVLVVVFGVFALIVFAAHRTPILKDQLIPQIEPRYQTYSLAKTQMAFWFLIILCSTLYFILFKNATLHDPIITSEALTLMGIAFGTGGLSAGVDRYRDTPEDSLNDALKAIGLSCYQDVEDLRANIGKLEQAAKEPGQATAAPEIPAGAKPSVAQIAQAQLNDLRIKLQFYERKIEGFTSQNFFKDLISNISGIGLHRLQAVIWTVVIGGVFVWEVYTGPGNALPKLDANLLTLMGISNVGYVGFKANETNY